MVFKKKVTLRTQVGLYDGVSSSMAFNQSVYCQKTKKKGVIHYGKKNQKQSKV